MNKDTISDVVISNVKSLIETFPDELKFTVNQNTILFGNGSCIDSLSLVSIIVGLESTFYNDYELDISLTDDKAMMREKSPFDSIQSLVDYIDEIVNGNQM